MLKYRFPGEDRAALSLTPASRGTHLSGISQSVAQSISNGTPTVVNKNSTAGFVIGGGVDLHFVVHIMPEIRYTRWGSTQVIDPTTLLKSNQNQAEFLLGDHLLSAAGLPACGLRSCRTQPTNRRPLRAMQPRAHYPIRPWKRVLLVRTGAD